MRDISIQIPNFSPGQNVEVEVKIDGRKRLLTYRVVMIEWGWKNDSPEKRISHLKRRIKAYEKKWELVEIGAPSDVNVQVMFRKRMR